MLGVLEVDLIRLCEIAKSCPATFFSQCDLSLMVVDGGFHSCLISLTHAAWLLSTYNDIAINQAGQFLQATLKVLTSYDVSDSALSVAYTIISLSKIFILTWHFTLLSVCISNYDMINNSSILNSFNSTDFSSLLPESGLTEIDSSRVESTSSQKDIEYLVLYGILYGYLDAHIGTFGLIVAQQLAMTSEKGRLSQLSGTSFPDAESRSQQYISSVKLESLSV
ncbi:uncharacterized protein MELLADRAFT_105468 [Melampsora larici-populina 98AG31]|uniref:Uncharacterized protein n=1 Tax=Melampsora larici-populina (strain 98AG31 / pathotype 3-4-7) TaxID=747676 RepID=F4RI81_MELLP|nr:uncharacterized protein MELLADRAFT_105468 [Melampsora larici-populina 98AG31]EGG07959.1 hypothetical protein MELLADRAFT_105468 [Melampsora larici-populina 98AG31]